MIPDECLNHNFYSMGGISSSQKTNILRHAKILNLKFNINTEV